MPKLESDIIAILFFVLVLILGNTHHKLGTENHHIQVTLPFLPAPDFVLRGLNARSTLIVLLYPSAL